MVGKVELEELHEVKASQKLEAGTLKKPAALIIRPTVLGGGWFQILAT